ncbi:uncharacterized protein N7469_011383 [Penicillium citrinum]|uniref:Uncharacterized protein n=1 Tax=Penicillium citrinum TaxID=5077 RepID=A0A9W9TCK0_PENCI|nr:uncharacterized protein N7469_011383 [Penicillium citrinum]KAJ5217758.1 hypothetical protein N7469_011383 [Penicillium citrinum]
MGCRDFRSPLMGSFMFRRMRICRLGRGVMGRTRTERGLTFVEVALCGHMVPQYQPSAAFRHLEFLLGRVDSLESQEPFTI